MAVCPFSLNLADRKSRYSLSSADRPRLQRQESTLHACEFEQVAAERPCNPARMLNIPFYFLFSLLTDDDFPPKTMEFRHFAMGKVRSAPKSLSRRCCFLAAHRRERDKS